MSETKTEPRAWCRGPPPTGPRTCQKRPTTADVDPWTLNLASAGPSWAPARVMFQPKRWLAAPRLPRYVAALCVWLGSGCGLALFSGGAVVARHAGWVRRRGGGGLKGPNGMGGASARCPWPELVGVADCPDVLDPVARDVKREHRHGDAVLLGHQPGLAVDRALQDRQAGCPAGDVEAGAGDLLGAFDRAERDGADQAAAVGDHRGVGVEQADEGADVLGFPGLLEGADEAGLPGGRGRGGLGGADAAAG